MKHTPETLAVMLADALAAHYPADVVAQVCDPEGDAVQALCCDLERATRTGADLARAEADLARAEAADRYWKQLLSSAPRDD